MTDLRQDAIRAFVKASFQGAFGQHDIATLKLTVYEVADQHDVLDLVILDNDMEEFGIEDRREILDRVEKPAPGANAATVSTYKINHQAWKDQTTAISETKKLLVGLLDSHAKKVVADPTQGTLMRTTLEMLTLLVAQYHNMSNEELRLVKTKWQEARWNQSEDLLMFLSNFNDNVTFLVNHDYGPPRGEQVTTMFEAIAHVPTLAAPTKAAFYHAFPAVEDQTLEALCEHLKTVYRTQYTRTTAAAHHEMNQATSISTDINDTNDTIVNGIAASARATLRGEHVSAEQLTMIQTAVTRAIKQCLTTATPPYDNRRDQPREQPRQQYNQRRDQHKGQDQHQRQAALEKGECPHHRGRFHSWDTCNQNPDRTLQKK